MHTGGRVVVTTNKAGKFFFLLFPKMFKFLNQCFAHFDVGKSVSNSQNLLAGSTAVLLETLF